MKRFTWNFHVDDYQVTHSYYMILVQNMLSELNICLHLSDNTIRVNVGVCERFIAQIKDISKISLKFSSDWLRD